MVIPRVTIYYVPSDGKVWADYIDSILRSKEYSMESKLCDFTSGSSQNVQNSTVNVFFITPDFLEHSDWQLFHAADKSTCILVLTGTDHAELEVALEHKCDNIDDYYIHEMKESDTSVTDLLIFIISKYEEEDSVEETDQTSAHRPLSASFSAPDKYSYKDVEKTDIYDILPKKGPRQVNFLHDILFKDKTLYILLGRRPEGNISVYLRGKEYVPAPTEYGVYQLRYNEEEAVDVKVMQDGVLLGKRVIEKETITNRTFNTSSRLVHDLPLTVSTQTVEHQTSTEIASANKETDPGNKTKDERKLETIRKLLEEEMEPEHILCQCLGIEKDLSQLDAKMTSLVQSVGGFRGPSTISRQESSEEESVWPTLVHFGAEFNLRSFCEALLSNPVLRGACLISNKNGHLPQDIARLKGHDELAAILQSFSEEERDSGISRTPRSSCESMKTEHRSAHTSGWGVYEDLGPECPELSEEEEYGFEKGHSRTLSSSTDKTLTPNSTELRLQDDLQSGSEFGTPIPTDDECDLEKVHHKNLKDLLGAQDEMFFDDGKTQTSKLKRLFTKRERSRSEPNVNPDVKFILRSKSTKTYSRNTQSTRSSGSSTVSTLSNELSEVQYRGNKLTHFGKRITKRFLESAKKRKSARIDRVLGDTHGVLPPLPSRLPYDQTERF